LPNNLSVGSKGRTREANNRPETKPLDENAELWPGIWRKAAADASRLFEPELINDRRPTRGFKKYLAILRDHVQSVEFSNLKKKIKKTVALASD